MSDAPRRIAAVLDGPPTPAWQARALAELDASPALDVVEVRLIGGTRRGALRRRLDAADRRVLRLRADALAPVEVVPRLLAGAPAPLVVWLAESAPPADAGTELLHLRHAGRVEPAADAVARAVLGREVRLETEALLRRPEGTVVVTRTVSGVRRFSVALTRDLLQWKLVALVRRAAERAPGLAEPAADAAPPRPAPATLALAGHAAACWLRIAVTRVLFRRPWSIRLRRHTASPTTGWERDEGLVEWRAGHVYADPFLFEHAGAHHLFCEEIPAGATCGVISHTELRLDGRPAPPPEPVLTLPCHLSYPFVFAFDGELLMVPETAAARRLELYRAVDFPRRWERAAVLLDDVELVDATVLPHEDRLWLFAAIAAPGASSLDELHLYWAEQPRGPWHPHPANPVVSDAACARPAGTIQHWDGQLVRPGQDGSRRYGEAVSFRAIDVLTPTTYAEHEIARLDPAALGDARATHTYAADGRFEAIDLRRRVLRVPRPRRAPRRRAA